jgi:general secretion pathway protein D
VKKIFILLALASLTVTAQTPPPPASATQLPLPPNISDAERAAAISRKLAERTNAAAQRGPAAPAAAPQTTAPRAFGPAVPPPTTIQTEAGETIVIAPPRGTTNTPPEEMIPPGMIDFRGTDVNQVLSLYAELVNRTVLRPATLAAQGQIVLRTQTPLTKSEAIQALDAVLAMNGIALINMGDKFVKAVPLAQAGQAGGEFSKSTADQMPDLGSYVTHVVQLEYVKPSEMMTVLQPFASAIPNPILPIDASQILVLRDYTENVKRMLEMIKKVDVSIPSEFVSEVIMIKYAQATEIANALNSLSSGGGATSVGASTGSTRGVSRNVGGMGNRMGTGGTMGMGGYPGSMGTSPFGSTTPAAGAATTGSSFTDRVRSLVARASGTGEITVLGNTKMIADERTNSLLVYASREDMKTIKEIVEKLDVVLAQVLIEAVIVEVTLGDNQDVGFSYLQKPGSSGNWAGAGAINNTSGFRNVTDFLSGSSNALSGGFSYLASFNNDLDIMVRAVADDNRARIVQRPRIQTSHNEPATLFVGESRPYPTGSYYGGGAYGGYSSIQQLPIGVTLTVTPLINPDGLVVMEISQDIQSAAGFVNIANVGDVPITSQKSAQAKVSVRDRDTIILGGLIENSRSRTRSGVPLLKDIPGLGFFFSSNSRREQRNEMIVMIRPTVLPTPEIAAVTAKAERDNMPLIKQAESEAAADHAKRLRKANKFDDGIKAGDYR